MKILKGAEVSAKIKEEVAQIAAVLQEVPKLAIIRVGAVSYTHLTLPTKLPV